MLKYFPLVLFLLVNSCGKATERTNDSRIEIVNSLDKTMEGYANNKKQELEEVSEPVFERIDPDTIDMDAFIMMFANLDLDCYDISKENGPLQSLFDNYEYHDQLFYIRDGKDHLKAFQIRGYLLSFHVENDSVYHVKYLGPGEVCWFVYLVTLNSTFEEIDRAELSSMGGDEEDLLYSQGCFQSRNEYLREDFFRSPVISEAVYKEHISSRRLTIKPDGEIYEEVLSAEVDTISTLLEAGNYKLLNGEDVLRILPQKKVELLAYDENGQVFDSLFGWYNYYSRQSFAEIELLKRDTDEYGLQVYKSVVDTVEVMRKGTCLEYRKERYYRN